MEKLKLLSKGLFTNIVFTAILLGCAGRLTYFQGWIFLAVNVLSTLLNYITISKNSDLLHERSQPGQGVKEWDKLILSISAILYLATIVIAGLDSGRFGWTGYAPFWFPYLGVFLVIFGQIIFLAARSQNQFFSSMVRIQKERNHVVCNTGLYKIVRHPGYLGMTISLLGIPFITTSLWSWAPTFLAITLLVLRTLLEDAMLKKELPGYLDYTKQTRYKWIPFIW